ncbi:MAG: hypothetical protein DHS20C15_04950 [Planctomycetota bacterium]|nr:MAG: hypothetical protein DHS20C15_04950 [Planctomycetota bacterium]
MSAAGGNAEAEREQHPLVDPGRPHRWALTWLLFLAGALILDDLFDAGVFKPAATALLAGLPLCVLLAVAGRDAAAAWFPSLPGRLLLLMVGVGALASRGQLVPSGAIDTVLLFGLAHVAAVLGLRAAEHDARALERGLLIVGGVVAAACVLQALDVDLGLSGGPDEVVGLSGNSTRAGALLAMAVTAGLTALTGGRAEGRADDPHSQRRAHYPLASWRSALPRCALLVLLIGACLLTRARGARLATLVALGVVAAAAWWRGRHPPQTLRTQQAVTPPARGRVLAALLALTLLGFAAAHALGGRDAVLGRKLEQSGPILEGQDLTTNVRLAVWSATGDMIAAAPGGWGLGGFRKHFRDFRDPVEAAMPGLAGAATEVHHPHNELLVLAAETGVLGALFGLLLVLLTARRAWVRCVDEAGVTQRVASAVFVCGLVLATLQNALHDVGTALPFWAAVGVIWSPRPQESRAWWLGKRSTGVLLVVLGAALALLAWPRLDSQLSLRSAFLAIERTQAVDAQAVSFFERALQATPRDPDVAALVKEFGEVGLRQAAQLRDVSLQARLVNLITAAKATLAEN